MKSIEDGYYNTKEITPRDYDMYLCGIKEGFRRVKEESLKSELTDDDRKTVDFTISLLSSELNAVIEAFKHDAEAQKRIALQNEAKTAVKQGGEINELKDLLLKTVQKADKYETMYNELKQINSTAFLAGFEFARNAMKGAGNGKSNS